MEIAAVLVSVEHRTGVGGVVLDTLGDVWLVHSLDGGGGPRLDDYRPDHVGLEGERTLLGGRLPAGAGEALVLDDRGDRIAAQVGSGAWAVVLDQPTRGERSPVCFRNEDGVPVFEPLPVVCRICGYEEVMGSVISLQPRDETDDPAVVQARIRKNSRSATASSARDDAQSDTVLDICRPGIAGPLVLERNQQRPGHQGGDRT